jgi:ABC-type spermidine/putrescine transport system permease subunit II
MLAVFSFELTFLVLITGHIYFASIPFVLGLVLGGYERYYTRIMKASKDPKHKA